jgi:hypothetical protein
MIKILKHAEKACCFLGAEKQMQKQKNNPLINLIVLLFSKTLLLLGSKVLTNNYQLKSATVI